MVIWYVVWWGYQTLPPHVFVLVCLLVSGLQMELAGVIHLSSSVPAHCCDKHPQWCSSQQSLLSFEHRYMFVNSVFSFTCCSSKCTEQGAGWQGGWQMWLPLPSLNWWRSGKAVCGGALCASVSEAVLCVFRVLSNPIQFYCCHAGSEMPHLGLYSITPAQPAQPTALCRNFWMCCFFLCLHFV